MSPTPLLWIYSKIPVISPWPIQLRKEFWVPYKREGLYSEGLISGIKNRLYMNG